MQINIKTAMRLITGLVAMALSLSISRSGYAQSDGLPRGAYQLPYTRYESEDASRGGGATLQQSPQFVQTDIASEASNQKYVSLASNGAYVSWTVAQPADGVTLRFTMPDNGSGTGLTGSLNVYVNNIFVQTVNLSSYHAYQYFPQPDPQQTPGGKTFMRFDEVHFKLASKINAGGTIKLQKDNGDAITYGVDFLELEEAPAEMTLPANFLSVTSYGAVPNDQTDDFAAFNQCIAAASTQGKGVYIPAGRFLLSDKLTLNVSNMKIQGAGIWYTEVYFSTDKQFYGGIYARATNVEISHFSMNTENNDRLKYDEANARVPGDMYKIYKGFMGTYGNNSRIHDVWVEHFECGFWIAGYDPPYPVDITTNLTISKCRIRNNYADGVNFCQGTSNSIVEQSSVRNNGDDGLAVWPDRSTGVTQPCNNNTFRFCTIENNWRAGGSAIFGGSGHQIHHSVFKDGVGGSAIRFTNDFPGFTFVETGTPTRIYENTITNCGTSYDLWDQKRGAIELYANTGIYNLQFDNNTILNSQRDAIQLQGNGIRRVYFNNTTIDGTGLDPVVRDIPRDIYGGFAIYAQANSDSAVFNNLTVMNTESGVSLNRNNSFKLIIRNQDSPLQGITLSPATLAITEGTTGQLTLTFNPAEATDKRVTWTSSNTAVATVTPTGTFGADIVTHAIGTTTVTVTALDGGFTATATITVNPAVNIVATDGAAGEGGNVGVFTIATSATAQNITVNYTIAGTASSGDYTANPTLTGSIQLTPSIPSRTITITPTDDAIFEGSETLQLTLQHGTGFSLGGNTTALITIADNDNPPCTSPVVAQISGTAPVINQTIESVWAIAPVRNISNVVLGGLPADYAGKWRALYNSANLYLLVEVNDAVKTNDSGTSWWEDDVIEIFIDGNNSKGTSYDGANDFQLGFRWNDNTIRVGGNSVTNTSGIVFNNYATASGYTLEVAIPWSTIGATPAVGYAIGLDVQVDDDDNGGTRDSQITSFATNTTAFQNPGVFGTVYLTTCSGGTNQAPTANAGTDKSLAAGTTTVSLPGSGTDPEGSTLTYSWVQVSGPGTTLTNSASATANASGLTNGNTYIYQLTVSDGSLTGSDQVQVTVAGGSTGDPAGVITCYRTAGTITVNGSLTETSWNATRTVTKNTISTANNTVTYGVLWDNTNLYIGARVLDATLNSDSSDPWENDAIEIFIDANNNKLGSYDGSDNQFIKAYNSTTLFAKVGVSGAQHAWAAITGGYSVEISIPWSQLGITPSAGTTIGFDIANDDDDNGGTRDAQAVWNGTIDNYANTSAFGSLVLNTNTSTGTSSARSAAPQDAEGVNTAELIAIFPNPTKDGHVRIQLPEAHSKQLDIITTTGRVVHTRTNITTDQTLDLSNLPQGLYLLRTEAQGRVITKKLIIE